MDNIEPTPEQIGAAKKFFDSTELVAKDPRLMLAQFLAARDAKKDRVIEELQKELERNDEEHEGFERANISNRLRAEQAIAANAMMAKELDAYADMCEGIPFEHKPIMGSNQQFSECIGCRAKAVLFKIKTPANPQ